MKITTVEALILHSKKSYTQGHGLVDAIESPSRRVLTDRYAGGRHLCTYPDGEQTVLVRIETDSGLTGWGEAHAPYAPTVTQTLIVDLLAPLMLGQDPMASDVLWERMYAAMRLRGHNTGFTMEAIAGVDIALWDLRGQMTGQPIYALLGGPYRTRLPAYASGVPGANADDRRAAAEAYLDAG